MNVLQRLIRADDTRFTRVSKPDYLAAIAQAGGQFDLIVIDGLYRAECLELARSYLAPAGMMVVDDTDAIPGLDVRVKQLFEQRQILPFRGWVSGALHPHETTVIRSLAASS